MIQKFYIIIFFLLASINQDVYGQKDSIKIQYRKGLSRFKESTITLDSLIKTLPLIYKDYRSILITQISSSDHSGYRIHNTNRLLEIEYFLNDTLSGDYYFINKKQQTIDIGFWIGGLPCLSWYEISLDNITNNLNDIKFSSINAHVFYDSTNQKQGLSFRKVNNSEKWPFVEYYFYINNNECLHFEGSYDSINSFRVVSRDSQIIFSNAELFEYINHSPALYFDAQSKMAFTLKLHHEKKISEKSKGSYNTRDWQNVIIILIEASAGETKSKKKKHS